MLRNEAAAIAASLVVGLSACATSDRGAGWTTLIDGANGLSNFNRVGEANWTATDGVIQATAGGKEFAFLVSRDSYRDFVVYLEFWPSDDVNSGIYMRCQDPVKISDEVCYEANIYDQRPDPTFGTGAITKFAKAPVPMPKAGGRWNTYEVTVKGPSIVVVLNGVKTAELQDSKFASGPIALQWGGKGTIKFRKMQVRSL